MYDTGVTRVQCVLFHTESDSVVTSSQVTKITVNTIRSAIAENPRVRKLQTQIYYFPFVLLN